MQNYSIQGNIRNTKYTFNLIFKKERGKKKINVIQERPQWKIKLKKKFKGGLDVLQRINTQCKEMALSRLGKTKM